jgi:hypothetical protein
VHPLIKSELLEEAVIRGITLSDLVAECIEIGWEQMSKEDVKQTHTGSTQIETEC